MKYNGNVLVFRPYVVVWMERGGESKSFRFPKGEKSNRVKKLRKDGWRVMNPQPKQVMK